MRCLRLPAVPESIPSREDRLPARESAAGGASLPGASRWRYIDDCPKDTQFADGVDELMRIHWLHHIGVHSELVAGYHVLFLARRREHHHRNDSQLRVGFDL